WLLDLNPKRTSMPLHAVQLGPAPQRRQERTQPIVSADECIRQRDFHPLAARQKITSQQILFGIVSLAPLRWIIPWPENIVKLYQHAGGKPRQNIDEHRGHVGIGKGTV